VTGRPSALGRTRRVHFVGVGGIGMSGIAELLANLGFAVSGSDATRSDTTDRLAAGVGVQVYEGHSAAQVGDADVVVFSSAVRRDNPEVVEAHRRGIPVIPRAEMLAELMRLRFSIAVAGAHGKTTTASMIALVLERAGLDPTVVIGGRLRALGGSARLGRGDYMVAEADESDRSFLLLSPAMAVVTNIDREHMETYGSLTALEEAFSAFANRVPFYGAVVACADDARVAAMVPALSRRVLTYGIESPAADVFGDEVAVGPSGGRCVVYRHEKRGEPGTRHRLGTLGLTVPGRHNLQNALAAVTVATELGVGFNVIADALAGFQGADRRFQRYDETGGVVVVDDYAHHPTEIRTVIETARAALERRLIVAFQPHRFSRTASLFDEFGPSLDGAAEVVLADVYAAGEDPIPGVTVEALADALRASGHSVHLAKTLNDVVSTVVALARPGDAVLTLGAGSIGAVAPRIVDALGRRGAS